MGSNCISSLSLLMTAYGERRNGVLNGKNIVLVLVRLSPRTGTLLTTVVRICHKTRFCMT